MHDLGHGGYCTIDDGTVLVYVAGRRRPPDHLAAALVAITRELCVGGPLPAYVLVGSSDADEALVPIGTTSAAVVGSFPVVTSLFCQPNRKESHETHRPAAAVA